MVNINEILCGVGYWEGGLGLQGAAQYRKGALHMCAVCILEKALCTAVAECLLENNCYGLICIFFIFL